MRRFERSSRAGRSYHRTLLARFRLRDGGDRLVVRGPSGVQIRLRDRAVGAKLLRTLEIQLGERAPRLGGVDVGFAYSIPARDEPAIAAAVVTPPLAWRRFASTFFSVSASCVSTAARFALAESSSASVHRPEDVNAQLVARKLGIGERYCVASPSYLGRCGMPRSPVDLVDHACILSGPSRAGTWAFEREGQTRAIPILGRYAVTSVDLLHRAALAGHGGALLPAFLCAKGLREGTLARVLEGWTAGETAVHLVYPSHRHLAARVRSFVDLVLERMPSFPTREISP